MDPWDHVEANRIMLADYLGGLSSEDWDLPTRSEEWSVEGVAAHLLTLPTVAPEDLAAELKATSFDLDKVSSVFVDRFTSTMSTDEIIDVMRSSAAEKGMYPGAPMIVLTEVLVHGTDIAVATGGSVGFPGDHFASALEFMKDVQPVLGCKKRVADLHLKATDVTWSAGEGPLVEGTAQDMLSAMTGRPAPLDSMTGDGVEVLRTRILEGE